MKLPLGCVTALAIGGAVAAVPLSAQESAPATAASGVSESLSRRAAAARVSEVPGIDGILDEAVWQLGEPLSDFVQSEPTEGAPASERTEVRLLYDDQALYVGVICYDSDPTKIITTDSRRDSGLGEMDSFQMIFDTYHDRQNGFIFGTNATGTEYDAQVRSEGESTGGGGPPNLGRAQGGAGGGMNTNWDGSWEVKARISDIGWSAEFRIPLRTLRYGPPPQVWGLNFMRVIRRKRENVFWSPISRIHNLSRLSSAGELRDLGLRAPRNLKVMPYAIGSANRNFTPGATNDYDGNWGVDAKVGVTSSMNLDLTYNTDFAQVEVDEQQINLTRFNLLFPEKRPFFIENRGLFAVGRSGEIDLFFSRRIGITDAGDLVPIQGGARLTGKVAGLNVGFVNMQTERAGTTPANNFTAARVSKDLPSRSSVGAIFVNRIATGSGAGDDDWNRTWGADAKVGLGEAFTFNGFAAKTDTPGLAGNDYAFGGRVEIATRDRRQFFDYTQRGQNFNPEVGFLERVDDYRKVYTGFRENVRSAALANLGFRELRPHMEFESFWGLDDGLQETATLHFDAHFDWENGLFFSPAYNIQTEGLREPFEVYPGVIVPPGKYRNGLLAWRGNTDQRRAVSFNGAWDHGGFLSGDQNSVAPSVTIRRGGDLSLTFRWTRNDIELPQGDFVTNLGNLRVAYNFTTLMNVQALIQYNDRTERWSTNLRFNWQRTAATGLYVVYNDTEAFNGLGPVNRAFVVKYSHMFDILQ
jgi:hypothetical protein